MSDAYELILVAMVKRNVATPAPDPQSQALILRILDAMDKLARHENGALTHEAIAAVAPACDRFAELYDEIMKLVPKRAAPFDVAQRCRDHMPAWRVFDEPDTFAAFVSLNPSLREAEKLCSRFGRCSGETAA
jgi:hypothetical protein